MKDRFFKSALAAARQSPEAFAEEFKKNEANANVKEFYKEGFGYFGDPLIHCIIKTIPDAQLPALLRILIQHNVDLEGEGFVRDFPLSLAAYYKQKDTVKFLIDNNARINTRESPALCRVMSGCNHDELMTFEIVKTLLKHEANINIQDRFSRTPLILAVENRLLSVMRYLLSQGANLFLKYTYDSGKQYKTALGVAYERYISVRRCLNEEDKYAHRAKRCLDLLIQEATDYLYRQGLKEANEELYITHSIKDLAGNFFGIYSESNSDALKKLLEESIMPAALARIRTERKQAFCMGSRLSKQFQQEQKTPIPPVYRFFQNDGRNYLTREIFSYAHPTMKSRMNT